MPALPDVPGVIRYQFTHTFSSDVDVMCHLFFSYTGTPPSATDLADGGSAAATNWNTYLAPYAHPDVTLTEVTLTDLTSPTSAQGSDVVSHAGTASGSQLAAATCLLVNYKIDRRYRGGKPRTYWPLGTSANVATAQTWGTGFTATMATQMDSFISAILATSFPTITLENHVSVGYYGPPNRYVGVAPGRIKTYSTVKAGPISPDIIVSLGINPKFGSQRRRNQQKR
jgi:hypothetical protein